MAGPLARNEQELGPEGIGHWIPALIALGFSSSLVQLTFIREMFARFQGQELLLGLFLASWMLFMGLGARLGGMGRSSWVLPGLWLLGLLPLATLWLFHTGSHHLFIRGTVPGLSGVALFLALLLPFCLLSGASLAWISAGCAQKLGRVYSLDTLGTMLGGLVYALFLASRLTSHQILLLQAFLMLLGGLCLREIKECVSKWVLGSILLLGLGSFMLWNPYPEGVNGYWNSNPSAYDEATDSRILEQVESPYGRLKLLEREGQRSLLVNGRPLLSNVDSPEGEALAHWPMIQRPMGARVLLLSGAQLLGDILKHQPSECCHLEMDPEVIRLGAQVWKIQDPRLRHEATDGRKFVQTTQETFDVLILGMAEPANLQENRFFTREFYQKVRSILRPSGVLATSLPGYDARLDPRLAELASVQRRTLESVFPHVMLLPGSRILFLASESPIRMELGPELKARKISVAWHQEDFVKETYRTERITALLEATESGSTCNEDFSPVMCFLHLRYWLSQFPFAWGGFLILAFLGFLIYLGRMGAVPFALFSVGWASSALSLCILLVFQVLHGSMYAHLGLLIALFMGGASLGSLLSTIRLQVDLRPWILSLALFSWMLPIAMKQLSQGNLSTLPSVSLIGMCMLGLGVLVGWIFPQAGMRMKGTEKLPRIWLAELSGASLGALVTGSFLLPILGFQATAWILAALLMGSALSLPKS